MALLVLGVVGGVGREGRERDVVVGGEDDSDGLDTSSDATGLKILHKGAESALPGRLVEGRAVRPKRFDRGQPLERVETREGGDGVALLVLTEPE